MRVLENLLKRIQALEKTIGGASMRKAFEVGERVRVYGKLHEPFVGTVGHISDDGTLLVRYLDGGYPVHPKQCRRLKAKRKPREWWMHREKEFDRWIVTVLEPKQVRGCEIVKVQEVL